MSDLSKRAVACKHWRWMPGMRLTANGPSTLRVCSHTTVVVEQTGAWYHLTTLDSADHLPDLTDPATLGCLLALVREATGLPVFVCQLMSGQWVVRYASNGLDDGFVKGKWGDTEAAALVTALEAAP